MRALSTCVLLALSGVAHTTPPLPAEPERTRPPCASIGALEHALGLGEDAGILVHSWQRLTFEGNPYTGRRRPRIDLNDTCERGRAIERTREAFALCFPNAEARTAPLPEYLVRWAHTDVCHRLTDCIERLRAVLHGLCWIREPRAGACQRRAMERLLNAVSARLPGRPPAPCPPQTSRGAPRGEPSR